MSNETSIDPMANAASRDGDHSIVELDNPLAELVAELDGVEVSPAFRPLKTTGNADSKISGRDSVVARTSTAEVRPSVPPQKVGLQSSSSASIDTASHPAEQKRVQQSAPMPDADATTNEDVEGQITIPARRNIAATSIAVPAKKETPKAESETQPETKRRSNRGSFAAVAVLLVVIGTGFAYVKGTQSVRGETVVYEVPVFDEDVSANSLAPAPAKSETAVTAERVITETPTKIDVPTPANNPEISASVVAAVAPTTAALAVEPPAKQKPLSFDDKFSDKFPELEGQSLLDLASGVATFGPADSVPDKTWNEVSCAGCHSFNQANLCEQGAYYFNHDKARLTRIQHPYGGGFKHKLMKWAEGGCQ